MKKTIYIFFLICSISKIYAQQFSRDFWHEGEIYTFAGQNLEGQIKYDLDKESVQIKLKNGTLQTFSSQKIEAFQFFDVLEKKQRIFYTLPYDEKADYKKPTFFELLADGDKINLLNREIIGQRSVPDMFYVGWVRTVYYIEDSFYVLQNEQVGRFIPDRDLKNLLKDKWQEVENFIKEKRLGTQNRYDLIQIFNFYNSL